MKTDLEVEVEVDLRPLGKVLIFRDRQLLFYINHHHHHLPPPPYTQSRTFHEVTILFPFTCPPMVNLSPLYYHATLPFLV